ncbi:MAG TPA: glycoside hydrolase family 38 C-terminal domain-containing protein [Capsulimonadaceae bacterium]|jgi:alpha-mannosidase
MLTDPKLLGKIARIEKTYAELRYVRVGAIDVEFAETRDHYHTSSAADSSLEWRPIETGHKWGDSWATGWFRGSLSVMPEMDWHPLFLLAATGGRETQLFVDGQPRGVFDDNHPVRMISLTPSPGHEYTIHLESYAGHSHPGTQPFDNPITTPGGAPQGRNFAVTKNCCTFEIVMPVAERPDVSAFVFELRTLRQLMDGLDADSLRKARLQQVLESVFAAVYQKPNEIDIDDWRPALAVARDAMRDALSTTNSATAPFAGIVGHSHIDTAWLWPINETHRKLIRTFSSVIALMDQYPEFRFTQSAPYHVEVVRDRNPWLFEQIKKRVKEGRWEINGAAWIEPDCNMPSGEALVRQMVHGQRSTREMFGISSDTLWQPDVFGYSAALPQILKQCGVKYFCTTKLAWNDTNKFPYDTFLWQGIDGTSLLAHFNRIHCEPDPETLIGAWKEVQHKDIQNRRLIAFGWGDGGGGPTAEMIEMARLVTDLEGCPRSAYMSVSEFMTSLDGSSQSFPRWVGELYLEGHRGTLTSIAAIKRLNRKCEFALRDTEFAATLATLLSGADYPAADIEAAWKVLLLNQFHDILPGTSIAEVNDQAIAALADCQASSLALTTKSFNQITGAGDGGQSMLLANSLSWDRDGELVIDALPGERYPVHDGLIVQEVQGVDGADLLALHGIGVPSTGFATVATSDIPPPSASSPFRFDGATVETPFAKIVLGADGSVTSFYDLAARRELVAAGANFNRLLLGEDVPAGWDNWDVDRHQEIKLGVAGSLLSRHVVADGPLQLRIRQRFSLGASSTLTQDIVFHSTTARVEFETMVEWNEKYRLLKVAFPTSLMIDSARHEIQYGHITRPAHDNTKVDRAQFDTCAHKWTDLSEEGYGVTFLNDCKYACTVKHSEFRLTLIKSGGHPDPRHDAGTHKFTYAILPHLGGFCVESVVRPAYELNLPVTRVFPVNASGTPDFTFITVSVPNVIIEAIKQSDDGDGVILRLYEAGRTGTHCTLKLRCAVSAVEESNLLEESGQLLPFENDSIELYFSPFEIKTIRLRF